MTAACPSCGEPVGGDDGFCEACGAELVPALDSAGAGGNAPECPVCSRPPEDITDEEMGVFPDYEAFCAAAG